MRETEITVNNGPLRLAGTLALPDVAGPVPLVLFLAGSGPLDRDENLRTQKLDVFNTLAADLARRGIASFRYDKRGVGKSTGSYHDAGHSDLLDDAAVVLRHFDGKDFGRRFLVGHSEGTALAAELSLIQPVDGLVLLSPFIQGGESMLIAQAARIEDAFRTLPGLLGLINRAAIGLLGSPVVHQQRLIARLKSTTEPSFRHGLRRIEAKSLREMMALDMPAIYARVTTPMLIVGGGKDVQCDPGDVTRIAAVSPAPKYAVPDVAALGPLPNTRQAIDALPDSVFAPA